MRGPVAHQLVLRPREAADADLHQAAAAFPQPPHDRAVRPVAAAQPVGQIGVRVDLHDRHVGRIVDQPRHHAVCQQVFASECDQEPLADCAM